MKVKKIPVTFDPVSDDVKELSNLVMREHHPSLVNAKIAYLYKNQELKEGKKIQYSETQKVNPKMKALCDIDFVITIHFQAWRELDENSKLIVLDHALSHCFVEENENDDVIMKVLKHDFEEFGHIISRYNGAKFFEKLTIQVKE